MGEARVKRAGARTRGVDLWFPTPIYSATLANRWNARLTREIYRLRVGGHVSHGSMSARAYTSYYTQNMLHTTPGLRPFFRAVLSHAYAFARALHADTRHFAIAITSSWANVYPRGEYVLPHSHPNCHLSGVFYVAAEPGCGDILFYSPLEYHKSSDITPVHEARSGVVRNCPVYRPDGAAHSLSELAEAHHAAQHELQGPDHRQLQLPIHFHDARRAITRGGSGMAKKKVKKRSAPKSKRKTGAKNLKAKSMKASAAARVRGGALSVKAPAVSYKDPALVSYKDPGAVFIKEAYKFS